MKWIVDSRRNEISVTYGEVYSNGWAGENKIILPEANPGTLKQIRYYKKIAQIIADALNKNNVVPPKE